jgi:Transposase IS116/IS110/IS902 family
MSNQLRAELERFWPGPIGLFKDLDSAISLAFLEAYPSPVEARRLGEKRLAAFLARQHYPGAQKPAQLLAKLRRAPEGRVSEAELNARRRIVLGLVATLKTLAGEVKALEKQIAAAVREHPDGEIFTSLFKDSFITAAELLAEIGDCRARYPNRDALAGDAGQAAVAIESGKRKAACFRWGCNKRLRGAFCTLADTTRHWHPWAQDLYAAAIARGHDHPRALRTVGRAWCRVVWRCWQDRTPYDPAHHRALQRHITVTIPTPSGPTPDTAATQRMLGAAVTDMAARRAEREALDGKPTSAISLGP